MVLGHEAAGHNLSGHAESNQGIREDTDGNRNPDAPHQEPLQRERQEAQENPQHHPSHRQPVRGHASRLHHSRRAPRRSFAPFCRDPSRLRGRRNIPPRMKCSLRRQDFRFSVRLQNKNRSNHSHSSAPRLSDQGASEIRPCHANELGQAHPSDSQSSRDER